MSETPNPDYSNSALIVWDMQYGIARRAFNYDAIVRMIKELLEAFHASGRPVVYSQHTGLPYQYLSKYMIATIEKRGLNPRKGGFLQEETQDWDIVKELSPGHDAALKLMAKTFAVKTAKSIIAKVGAVH